ncbi:hypothetical protein CIPAW_10G122200 [Carya illinoinensis]|uniref:Uncharacterized protein n=1 Tax=Carya illinoinensis TaxID=32201 RepID=A0A8T1PF17_CARIL|nr:hypothetical protein CIPAW_10G122200 [Carya illinoinensis]
MHNSAKQLLSSSCFSTTCYNMSIIRKLLQHDGKMTITMPHPESQNCKLRLEIQTTAEGKCLTQCPDFFLELRKEILPIVIKKKKISTIRRFLVQCILDSGYKLCLHYQKLTRDLQVKLKQAKKKVLLISHPPYHKGLLQFRAFQSI